MNLQQISKVLQSHQLFPLAVKLSPCAKRPILIIFRLLLAHSYPIDGSVLGRRRKEKELSFPQEIIPGPKKKEEEEALKNWAGLE